MMCGGEMKVTRPQWIEPALPLKQNSYGDYLLKLADEFNG